MDVKDSNPSVYLNVADWEKVTDQEIKDYIQELRDRARAKGTTGKKGSIISIRQQITPVDMYCYLKARFGNPNGIQTMLAQDDSDNWIHWDYEIKVNNKRLTISGMSREIHLALQEDFKPSEWKELIIAIKKDFGRVGKSKGDVKKSLERWVLFTNKYVSVANLCAEKHEFLKDYLDNRPLYNSIAPSNSSIPPNKKTLNAYRKKQQEESERRSKMYGFSLELSLLTPVMAEAFINMVILCLCKKDVRNNKRQLESFIRANIDEKIFDLFYKCDHFEKTIDFNDEVYKNFKRVMDKRNHAIHGNIEPEREAIETVYFERKRPLFEEPGDNVGKYFESIERQANIVTVIRDYENTHAVLAYIVSCLPKDEQEGFWAFIEDPQPGYDFDRKVVAVLFPDVVMTAVLGGLRYDDELPVDWKN